MLMQISTLHTCSKVDFTLHHTVMIGASLSEPHTSGTALRKCVNVRTYVLACLRPYTVNFKCTFKYFLKNERPRVLQEI